jgi:light-regulated signal transduction histidine kinase (bacteriophytochrome)
MQVHIAYMHNMGVKASMSIGINVGGALWGLYAFHGYTFPIAPSAQEVSFQIDVAEVEDICLCIAGDVSWA